MGIINSDVPSALINLNWCFHVLPVFNRVDVHATRRDSQLRARSGNSALRRSHLCLDVYAVETLRALAEQFLEEGLYGAIPEHLQFYIGYDAIARDLGVDYTETVIAGVRLVYRCG